MIYAIFHVNLQLCFYQTVLILFIILQVHCKLTLLFVVYYKSNYSWLDDTPLVWLNTITTLKNTSVYRLTLQVHSGVLFQAEYYHSHHKEDIVNMMKCIDSCTVKNEC